MKEYVSIALYSAASGAILALIGGIFGGVDFASIIFRMIVSSAIVLVLAVSGALIVRKFLPELWSLNSAETISHSEDQSVSGGKIDIVVDDDQAAEPTGDDSVEEENEENTVKSVPANSPPAANSMSDKGNEVDSRKFALAIQTMLNKE
ncbi:MAG: hypothetical protein ACR2PY_07865 [Salinispira sp.]